MRYALPLIVAVLLFALLGLIAGCGGSSSSSSTAGTSASTSAAPPFAAEPEPETSGGAARAAVIKEGDAICLATDEVTATLQGEFKKVRPGGPNYEKKLAELLVRIVVIGRNEEQELAALEPPAKDTTTIERWLTVGGEGLGDFEAAAVALKAGNSAKFNRLYEEGQSALGQANQVAAKYGFKVCGDQTI